MVLTYPDHLYNSETASSNEKIELLSEEDIVPSQTLIRIYPKVENLDRCLIDGYEFKKPIDIIINYEVDYFICYDKKTNQYGTGNTPEEAKKDYCNSLIEQYDFLIENRNNLFHRDKEILQYLERVILKR